MKVELLIDLLQPYKDFELVVRTSKITNGIDITDFSIKGICDIGYSDRVILLDGEEIQD